MFEPFIETGLPLIKLTAAESPKYQLAYSFLAITGINRTRNHIKIQFFNLINFNKD
jgi:hypothetical protein